MRKICYFIGVFLYIGLLSSANAQSLLPVRFEFGNAYFPDNFGAVGIARPAPEEVLNGYYARYIQCRQIPTDAERQAVELAGVQFVSYMDFGAYLVLIPEKFDLRQLARLHTGSIIPVQNTWKLAKSLREEPFGAWAVQGDMIDINLQLYPHIGLSDGANWCRRQGIEVLMQGTQNGYLKVRIHKDHIESVAALPYIRFMELIQAPGKPEDTQGRALHRANLLDSNHPSGKKYNGDGVRILVRDDGKIGPHIDFQGRLFNYANEAENVGTHGDGVSGILAGAGNLNPAIKGMAAGAQIYLTDYEETFQDTTLWLHQNKQVTLTNSSYSNGCNTGYTTIAQTIDQQIFENPTLMHVFSGGNSNGADCGYGAGPQWGNITGGHKMAKNSLAVANLQPDATLDPSSSRGPAHDGRLKPDISANGTAQQSTDISNTYQQFGGTSGAAPGVAGCLAQLTHAYKTLNNGTVPPSALLKAVILNTANDLGNPGPDFQFGWGHINAFRALNLLEQNNWTKGQISQGTTKTHTIQIPDNTRLAKIMVYWAERPANASASKALINDLDLTVSNGDTNFLPWKLDPTPNPDNLNAPAGKGRDSLNNVEQVALENPAPGTYTIQIKGNGVPLGPQEYYVVWEFLNDQIKMVYPNGGEGFSPGDTVRINWDAFGQSANFTLRLLSENGINTLLTTQVGTKRMYDWRIPANMSGKVRIIAIRGTERDTSDQAFLVSPPLQNVEVEKVCPTTMTLRWNNLHDTIHYAAYLLGEKYMELAGVADTNFLAIPISNPHLPKWYAAAPMLNGAVGKRSIAKRWAGGLKNCQQSEDISIRQLLAPTGGIIIRCTPGEQAVQIKIKNDGINPLTNPKVHYQTDNQPVVDESTPSIAPGDSLIYTFNKKLNINFNGTVNLRIWADYPGEDYPYNDTINVKIPVVSNAAQSVFSESVEGAEFPPSGWIIQNIDNDKSWEKKTDVADKTGNNSTAFLLNCYNYKTRGAEDVLYTIPVSLTSSAKQYLTFDFAHARFDGNYAEQLRVEILSDCSLQSPPVVVWEKTDPELATAPDNQNPFEPTKNDWRSESIDLSSFINQSIIIRFVGVNDYGNNIYLDNISVIDFQQPEAIFTASNNTICRQDTVIFSIPNVSNGVTYAWSFGLGAAPYTTSVSPGPHYIRYATAGTRTVRMILSSPLGKDTVRQLIRVLNLPVANFSVKSNALEIQLTNTSTNATSYLWDFGDNTTSTEANPNHIYSTGGAYNVKLTASNECRTVQQTIPITVSTVGVQDVGNMAKIQILPNPTAGDFVVELESAIYDTGKFYVSDAQGRLIQSVTKAIQPGKQSIAFTGLNLPKGLYQVQVQLSSASRTYSVSVQ